MNARPTSFAERRVRQTGGTRVGCHGPILSVHRRECRQFRCYRRSVGARLPPIPQRDPPSGTTRSVPRNRGACAGGEFRTGCAHRGGALGSGWRCIHSRASRTRRYALSSIGDESARPSHGHGGRRGSAVAGRFRKDDGPMWIRNSAMILVRLGRSDGAGAWWLVWTEAHADRSAVMSGVSVFSTGIRNGVGNGHVPNGVRGR